MKKIAILILVFCLVLATFSACGTTTDNSSGSDLSADSSSYIEPKPYTITYECNGGSEIQPVNYGADEMPIKPEEPVLEGFNFLGWYFDAEFTKEFNFDYPLNQDTTLYAYFSDAIFISTAEELNAIRDNVDTKYVLTADIILKGATWEPIETFNGELDGNGHKISYFLMSTDGALSGFIKTNNGTIKNIIFDDVAAAHASEVVTTAGVIVGINNGSILNCSLLNSSVSFYISMAAQIGTANSYTGAFVGKNSLNAKLENCTVDCVLDIACVVCDTNTSGIGSTAGMFSGYLWCSSVCGLNEGTIINCNTKTLFSIATNVLNNKSYATIRGAGAVGYNSGSINGCSVELNSNKFTHLGTNREYVDLGGIVNENRGSIERANAVVKIQEADSNLGWLNVGGAVCRNYSSINDSFSVVDIKTTKTVCTNSTFSGFVAYNYGSIGSSYATGTIECTSQGNIMGGFVGVNGEGGAINGCISEVRMINTAQENFGAFVGRVDAGVTLKCFYSSATQMYVGEEAYEYVESVTGIAVAQAEEIFTTDFIFGNLYWDEEVWQINGELPTLR